MQRYPRIAAAIAKPVPVLPLVGSTIVPPGLSKPWRSAASSIATAGRSLTLPPGFTYSTLPSTRHAAPSTTLFSRNNGVWPMASSAVSQYVSFDVWEDGAVLAIGAPPSARRTPSPMNSLGGRLLIGIALLLLGTPGCNTGELPPAAGFAGVS